MGLGGPLWSPASCSSCFHLLSSRHIWNEGDRKSSHPSPFSERAWGGASPVVIVRAGVVRMWGGDPCGRPGGSCCLWLFLASVGIVTCWDPCGRPGGSCCDAHIYKCRGERFPSWRNTTTPHPRATIKAHTTPRPPPSPLRIVRPCTWFPNFG